MDTEEIDSCLRLSAEGKREVKSANQAVSFSFKLREF